MVQLRFTIGGVPFILKPGAVGLLAGASLALFTDSIPAVEGLKNRPALAALGGFTVFGFFVLHEVGHAIYLRRLGIDVTNVTMGFGGQTEASEAPPVHNQPGYSLSGLWVNAALAAAAVPILITFREPGSTWRAFAALTLVVNAAIALTNSLPLPWNDGASWLEAKARLAHPSEPRSAMVKITARRAKRILVASAAAALAGMALLKTDPVELVVYGAGGVAMIGWACKAWDSVASAAVGRDSDNRQAPSGPSDIP